MGDILVSIIVPIYKVEKYLNQCVESIVNQTYTNLEIILVDDGSPDSCGAICDEWAQKDTRIKVIHQENRGLSGARNTGIEHSNGQYLMFVDSDDYVVPEYVERLFCSIVMNQADMAMCGFFYLSTANCLIEKPLSCEREVLGKIDALLGLERVWEEKELYIVVWNKLYSRKLWETTRFKEGVLREDEFVMPKLYEKCNCIAIENECLYVYRRREASITAEKNEIFCMTEIDYMMEREKVYQKIGAKELLIMHQIHLYSVYDNLGMRELDKKKEIQRKIRKYYFFEKYATKISVLRRIKDLLAVINVSLYHYIAEL